MSECFRCQTVSKRESFSSVRYELWRRRRGVAAAISSVVTKRLLDVSECAAAAADPVALNAATD